MNTWKNYWIQKIDNAKFCLKRHTIAPVLHYIFWTGCSHRDRWRSTSRWYRRFVGSQHRGILLILIPLSCQLLLLYQLLLLLLLREQLLLPVHLQKFRLSLWLLRSLRRQKRLSVLRFVAPLLIVSMHLQEFYLYRAGRMLIRRDGIAPDHRVLALHLRCGSTATSGRCVIVRVFELW